MPDVMSPEQALHDIGSVQLTSRGSLELRKDRRNKAKVYFNSGNIYYADLQGHDPALLQRLKWSLELALPEDDPKHVDIQAILTGYKGKDILNQLLSRRLITDGMLGIIAREHFIATMQHIFKWDKVTTRWNVRDGIDRKDPYNIPDPLSSERLSAYLQKRHSYHVAFAQWLNISEADIPHLQIIPPADFTTVIPETDEEFLIIGCLGSKPTFTKLVKESGFMMPSKILQSLATLNNKGVLDFYLNGNKIIVLADSSSEEHFNYLVESGVKYSDRFVERTSHAEGIDNFLSSLEALKKDDEPTDFPELPPKMLEPDPEPVVHDTEEDMYIEVGTAPNDLVESEIESSSGVLLKEEGLELPALSAFAVRSVIPEEIIPTIEEEIILNDDLSILEESLLDGMILSEIHTEEHDFILGYEKESASQPEVENDSVQDAPNEGHDLIDFNVNADDGQDDQYAIFDMTEDSPVESDSDFFTNSEDNYTDLSSQSIFVDDDLFSIHEASSANNINDEQERNIESPILGMEPVFSPSANEHPETRELISHHAVLDDTDEEPFDLQEELISINTPLGGNGVDDDDVFNKLTDILSRAKESINRDRERFNETNAKYQEAESAYQKQIARLKEIEEEHNRLSAIVQKNSQSIEKLRSDRDALASRITKRENQLKTYIP